MSWQFIFNVFTVLLLVSIVGWQIAKIIKTNSEFNPKSTAQSRIKKADLFEFNLSFWLCLAFYLINMTVTMFYKNNFLDFVVFISFLLILLLIIFNVKYYNSIYIYDDGFLVQDKFINWTNCTVELNESSFISNEYIKISFKYNNYKTMQTKSIKLKTNEDTNKLLTMAVSK